MVVIFDHRMKVSSNLNFHLSAQFGEVYTQIVDFGYGRLQDNVHRFTPTPITSKGRYL